MSDLRTRIAAAIAQADQDWCSDNNLYEDMADAVIRELEADVMADDYVPPCCRPGGRCNR